MVQYAPTLAAMLQQPQTRPSPQEVARKRALAEALKGNQVKDAGFLGALANTLSGSIAGYENKQAAQMEAAGQESARKSLAKALQDPNAGIEVLAQAATNPFITDQQSAIASMLMGERMRQDDPAYQLDLQMKQAQLAKFLNPDIPAPEYDFMEMDNGELIRTDNQGNVESMGQFGTPEPTDPFTGTQVINGQLVTMVDGQPQVLADFRTPEDPQGTAKQQDFNFLLGRGVPPEKALEMVFSGGDTNVNVNMGEGAPGLGKLSTDYGYVLDPETGQPKIDPATGLPTAAPVPGSPAALAIEQANAAQVAGSNTQEIYADVVKEDIDRALTLLKEDPTFTTGMFGKIMGNWTGSNADRMDQFLNTVRSNVAFDRLQQMREASPTGGALGAVTERELSLLQSAIGSLERSNPDDLAFNLQRVQQIYDQIMEKASAYPNAGQFGFGGASQSGGQSSPQNIDEILKGYGL